MICPHCKKDTRLTFKRGPWSVLFPPVEVAFRGKVLPLRPAEANLLALIIREEKISVEAAHNAITTGPFTCAETGKVALSRLRGVLRGAGVTGWRIGTVCKGTVHLRELPRS